jgi:hypothetical protein
VLKQVQARTLTGVRHGVSETVDGSFTTNEAMKLSITVTPFGSSRKLTLLKGSKLGSVKVTKSEAIIKASPGSAGQITFHVVVRQGTLVKGKAYVVHISATNARGRTATLTVRFRA